MAPRLRSPSPRSSRSSRPLRSSRMKVQSYYEESDSDDALDGRSDSDEELLGRTTASFRPRRSSHAPISYREDSTDDSLDEENNSRANEITSLESTIHFTPPAFEAASNGTPSRVRRPPTGARGQTRRSAKSSNKRGLEIGRPLRKKKYQKIEAVEPLVGSGVIPPWQTLPYHVLFDIFFYASHPLVDKKGGVRLSSVQWLVNVALLCHAFLEPALAALYYSPPLIPVAKTHGLLSLLCRQQESLSISYANKIKVLDVDVEGVLAHKSGPLGYFELPRLIEATPQVKALRLYHRNDYIVGLPHWQIPLSKWTYPEALFSSLNASSIILHSWDWNGRFMDAEQLLPFIFTIHQQRAFRGLRELRLLHIAGPSFEEDSSVKQMTLAAALKQLPGLCRLEFRECSILDGHLLSNLSSGLTCLTIDNCDEVMTSDLEAFLASYGYNLRELNLNHNRNLSLSFLAGLAQFCGCLERLKMDLSMHDWSSDHDVEPHFDELLNPSEVPAWPPTLQDIEFIQLRKWDDATAEVFFTSLVHAAPYLRDLRRLVISAILRIGWRDRASFRERWIRRLETTFLRRSKPPDSNLTAVRQPAQPALEGDMPTEDVAIPDAPTGNGVSSAHSTPSKRKSARLAQRRFLENEDQRDTRSVRSMSSSPTPNRPIQGMCDIVMIRIDNQRPTETQFNESDFLDEELSGDEDWTGRDLDIPDSHAW